MANCSSSAFGSRSKTAAIADHVWTLEEIVALVPEEDVVILK